MSIEPDFTKIISAAKRVAQEQADAEEAREALKQAARERELAIAEEALGGIVAPLLEKARHALQQAETMAEIGNGRDRYQCIRLSLRIAKGREALVFTACSGLAPYLGWHTEPVDLRCDKVPASIASPTPEEIARIISQFISESIKQPLP